MRAPLLGGSSRLTIVYSSSDPIANGSAWSPKADIASQLHWQSAFSSALGGKTDFIEAGVYLQPPKFSIQNLAPAEGGNLPIVKTFADHSYPQSACGGAKTNLEALMNHPDIVQYVAKFKPEVAAAKAAGKPIVFGETNSATCGGGGISPTFGAGLWIVDYVFQSVILGYERLYFHHGMLGLGRLKGSGEVTFGLISGTVGNSPYSWWGANNVFAPYYGRSFESCRLPSQLTRQALTLPRRLYRTRTTSPSSTRRAATLPHTPSHQMAPSASLPC